MTPRQAAIYINKIAAAKRQLDTAIRFYFAKEDALAIHTVAAAAAAILQDIIRKEGGNLLADVLQLGFYTWAKRYTEGKMSDTEVALLKESGILSAHIQRISADMKRLGAAYDPSQIKVEVTSEFEQRTWPRSIANFLKHADRDAKAHLALAELDNEELLIRATMAYFQVTKDPSPEMIVYGTY